MGLNEIYNIVLIDDRLATAGQPVGDQFAAVKDAGYNVVINLAKEGNSEHFNPDEPAIWSELGVTYRPIPVEWSAPATADFRQFVQTMNDHAAEKCFVHCIANMRVSAFVYLYRVIERGVPLPEARAVMQRIWTPDDRYPAWKTFIEEQLKAHNIHE